MKINLTQEQQFLCCAIADDEAWHQEALCALLDEVGDETAFALAEAHDAASIVACALAACLDEKSLPAHWNEAHKKIQKKLTLFMKELDRVGAALAKANIPLLALKNSGIARGIYPNLAGSPMGDIDVLVDVDDFDKAHAIMLELGFVFDSRSPLGEKTVEEAKRSGGSEYRYVLDDGSTLWFELQWRVVAGRWINENQEPKAKYLIARSVPIKGSDVRLLAPTDNLLQVALHTAKHSYVRAPGFRLHTDVDRIVRRCDIDWGTFCREVERLTVCTAVYFSLVLASYLLHTPVPDWVLNRLKPAWWKRKLILRSLLRVDLFNPDDPKWSRLGYIVFNILLYDSPKGLFRGLFPSVQTMRQRHGLKSVWTLPFFYVFRMMGLILKRANH
jgi:hypothetical protein